MKKILFFFVVLLTSVQMMAQDVTDGRRYFSFIEESYSYSVTGVHSQVDFNIYLESKATIMAMFGTNWCGPCKMIRPYFFSLPNKYPTIAFIYVDADECKEIADDYNLNEVPTFILYKNGIETKRIEGANKQKLDALLYNEISH